MASLSALEQSAEVAKHFPVITRTLLTLSNVRVRNVARVGGALAHGDPHMDLPPLLASLGAVAHVVGREGTREIAVQDLYLGYYETVLAKDELIAEVTVPPLNGARTAYMKCTSRSADDWPALNLALRWDGGARRRDPQSRRHRQRRDGEGHASFGSGEDPRRLERRREDGAARGRCGGRGSELPLRCARVGCL